MTKSTIIVFLLLAVSVIGFGQDRNFSQFYASPLTYNPATAGGFDGRHRLIFNHRNQWASLLPDPFLTTGISYDLNFSPFKVQTYQDKIGLGLTFFNDKAGPADFTTNQIGFTGAYHKALDMEGNHYLSAGFQLGIVQRSLTYDNLTFNDQFDGSNGYILGTTEVLPVNNYAFGDLSAGLQWSLRPKRRTLVFAGAAFHHITQPQNSLYSEDPDILGDNRLFMKIVGHVGAQLPMGRKGQFQPRAIYYKQGPHTEINAGANLRFSLSDYNDTNFFFGGWLRPVSNESGDFSLDAVVALVGFQLTGFQVGLSYDVTTSALANVTSGRGAFELSIMYVGSYENESVICPTF